MKFLIGKYIKLLLSNNIQVDGFVEEWNDHYLKVNIPEEKCITFIPQPNKNVIVAKVYDQKPIKSNHRNEIAKSINEANEEFEEQVQEIPNDELRLQTLAQLKNNLIVQEKNILKNKIKDHHAGGIQEVKYGIPRITKK